MAAGQTLCILLPAQVSFPASNSASPDSRNIHPVLDFDGTTDEEAYFEDYMPSHYSGGAIAIDLLIGLSSATSGTSRWQTDLERLASGGQDTDSDGFTGSFQSNGGAANGSSGIPTIITIAHTAGAQMDSIVAGDKFRLKVRRDADGTSGTDDIATDAELHGIVIRET